MTHPLLSVNCFDRDIDEHTSSPWKMYRFFIPLPFSNSHYESIMDEKSVEKLKQNQSRVNQSEVRTLRLYA